MSRPFAVDHAWSDLAQGQSLRPANVLRSAGLPEDLFRRRRASLASDELHRLWEAFATAVDPEAPGILMAKTLLTKGGSHPLTFAALCCADVSMAANRFAQYVTLTGPVQVDVHAMAGGLELTLASTGVRLLPNHSVAAHLAALVGFARQGTGHHVRPVAVEMAHPPSHAGYTEFFGHPINEGPFNRVVFAPSDAKRLFLPPEPSLFQRFDADLRMRLDELPSDAALKERVQSVLMEALPSGHAHVATVAERLGKSARTLQRRLGTEAASFQDVLTSLRERLARYYLQSTPYRTSEIAFLLGYDDPNSFIRAFHSWTGTTPVALRKSG